jgi:uncharacterized protein YecE (DUF72 family)
MQYPPYFTALEPERLKRNLRYLEYCGSKLSGYRMLVEFRHPSWVLGRQLGRTMEFLRDQGMYFVSVDAPQFPGQLTMPPIAAATGDLAYVRFHGRNKGTYFSRTASAADRFDYLYSKDELAEWTDKLRSLAAETEVTYAMFNNCRYDYAPRNAADLGELLSDVVEPVPGGAPPGGESGTLF